MYIYDIKNKTAQKLLITCAFINDSKKSRVV
jgi:hypothetical protein